jgi:hypothetical protein
LAGEVFEDGFSRKTRHSLFLRWKSNQLPMRVPWKPMATTVSVVSVAGREERVLRNNDVVFAEIIRRE